MIKFSHRLSIIAKTFLLFLSLSGLLYTLFRYAYSEIEKGILNEYGLVIDSTAILSQINLQPITLICVTCIGILVILVIDIATFTKRINKEIRDSLKERKLEHNFSNFYNSNNFNDIITHLEEVFSLYKSFDNLKTSRTVLEVGTIKQIINNMSKGVILINKDLVVTHANHVIEDMLGLIPGEILGQAISRQVNNDILLASLEKSLEFDQKFINFDLEENDLEATIIPLKINLETLLEH